MTLLRCKYGKVRVAEYAVSTRNTGVFFAISGMGFLGRVFSVNVSPRVYFVTGVSVCATDIVSSFFHSFYHSHLLIYLSADDRIHQPWENNLSPCISLWNASEMSP